MKKKNEKHTKIVNSICSWKISGFLLGNLRLPLDIFDSLRTSSVVFGISLAVGRRESALVDGNVLKLVHLAVVLSRVCEEFCVRHI